jgi:hypothetical protein
MLSSQMIETDRDVNEGLQEQLCVHVTLSMLVV